MFPGWPRSWHRIAGRESVRATIHSRRSSALCPEEKQVADLISAYLLRADNRQHAIGALRDAQITALRDDYLAAITAAIEDVAALGSIELFGGGEADLFEPEDGQALRVARRLVGLLVRRSTESAWTESGLRGRLRVYHLAELVQLNHDANQIGHEEAFERAIEARQKLAALGRVRAALTIVELRHQPRPKTGKPRDPAIQHVPAIVGALERWLRREFRKAPLSDGEAKGLADRVSSALRRRVQRTWVPLLPVPPSKIAVVLTGSRAPKECAEEIVGLATRGRDGAARTVRRWIEEHGHAQPAPAPRPTGVVNGAPWPGRTSGQYPP